MATIGSLAVNVVARTSGLASGLTRSRSLISSFTRSAVAGMAATAAAAYAAQRAFMGMAPKIDRVAKTADKLGLTTEALSGLHHAAKLSGLGINTLDMAVQRMVRRVAEAAHGMGEARGAIAELGLSAAALARLPADQQLARIADRMAAVESQADRVRLAFKLFDSEGVAMVNVLKDGSAGLAAARDDAERLGLTFTRQQGAMVEAANDAMTRAGAAVDGLKMRLTIGLAPVVEDIANKFADWAASMDRLDTAQSGGGGLGKFVDVLHTIKLGFYSVQLAITTTIAAAVRNATTLVNTVVKLVNKLPGVNIERPQFANALAEELDRSATNQRGALNKMFLEATPSEMMGRGSTSAPAAETAQRAQGMGGGVGVQAALGLDLAVRIGQEVTKEQQRLADRADQLRELVRTPAERLMESIDAARDLVKRGLLDQNTLDRLIGQQGAEQARQAEQLRKSVQTPMERFRDEIAKYQSLFATGGIDFETAQRLTARAGQGLGGLASRPRFAQLQEISQSDRLFADRGNEAGKDPMREAVKTAKDQLAVLKEIRDGKGKNKGGTFVGDINVRMHNVG